ncbi:MAG: DUF3185 family protein [Candidatus Omnitrophota bacterium]
MNSKGSGAILLVAGLIISGLGISFLDSFASRISEALQGASAEKALWMLMAGVVATMAGTILVSKEG